MNRLAGIYRRPQRDVALLASIFAVSGLLHFVRPRPFERIVPRGLPRRRELVYASGALELACAAGLVVPSTRRLAGLASAGLLVAVFPANIQMALDIGRGRSTAATVAAVLRLPVQWLLIRTGWRAYRSG